MLEYICQIPDNYAFNGYPVSRNVIEAYLTRSMSTVLIFDHDPNVGYNNAPVLDLVGLQNDQHISRNLQLIDAARPKYLHRAVGEWGVDLIQVPGALNRHWDNAEWLATQVHNIDPEIIIEAALYESVRYPGPGILWTDPW